MGLDLHAVAPGWQVQRFCGTPSGCGGAPNGIAARRIQHVAPPQEQHRIRPERSPYRVAIIGAAPAYAVDLGREADDRQERLELDGRRQLDQDCGPVDEELGALTVVSRIGLERPGADLAAGLGQRGDPADREPALRQSIVVAGIAEIHQVFLTRHPRLERCDQVHALVLFADVDPDVLAGGRPTQVETRRGSQAGIDLRDAYEVRQSRRVGRNGRAEGGGQPKHTARFRRCGDGWAGQRGQADAGRQENLQEHHRPLLTAHGEPHRRGKRSSRGARTRDVAAARRRALDDRGSGDRRRLTSPSHERNLGT